MTEAERSLEARARLFRALGHPARLLILNLLGTKPRHGEELAALLRLQPATVSHHLKELTEAGLVRSRKDQYFQVYELWPAALDQRLADLVSLAQPALSARVEEDAYHRKVVGAFLVRGRLSHLPRQRRKRQMVLEEIVAAFEPDREYTEAEVNARLLDFHEDVATVRRALVEHGLMSRDHGRYWRPAAAASQG
jgi:DNA-binding MarR family transcriptional regulator